MTRLAKADSPDGFVKDLRWVQKECPDVWRLYKEEQVEKARCYA